MSDGRVSYAHPPMNRRARLTSLPALAALAVLPFAATADAKPTLKLGKAKIVRGEKYITDDALLDTVAPQPADAGRGGITDVNGLRISGCQDTPGGVEKGWVGKKLDAGAGLSLEVTTVEDAGTSKRGLPGAKCGFKVVDTADSTKYAVLPAAAVPPFTAPTALLRDGDMVYMNLNVNGYAKEFPQGGNLVVALHMVNHDEMWRTGKFTSNAAMMLYGDVLITGYGFTKEKAAINVIDTATGAVIQKVVLPKSPSEIRRKDSKLFVRIYDGYAVLPITGAK